MRSKKGSISKKSTQDASCKSHASLAAIRRGAFTAATIGSNLDRQAPVKAQNPGENNMRLQGLSTIVTGGASGFGAEIARAYAREGAKVVIFDLNAEGAKK